MYKSALKLAILHICFSCILIVAIIKLVSISEIKTFRVEKITRIPQIYYNWQSLLVNSPHIFYFYYNFTPKHFLKCSFKKVFFDIYSKSNGEQLWRTVISIYIIVNFHECASVELLHALWTCFIEEIPLGAASVYCKTIFCTCIFKGTVMQIKWL